MNQYSVVIQWSDVDNGYIAFVPELEGLSAFGETQDVALRELTVAKEAYLEVLIEDGCISPQPEKVKEFSGQTRLRLPKSLHAKLSYEAKSEGVSLNTIILKVLAERHGDRKLEREIENLKNIVIGSIPLRAEPDLRKTSSDIDSVLLFQVFKEINQ